MTRDYKKERRDYYGYGKYEDQTDEQKRHRREMAGRKAARETLKKEGRRSFVGGPRLRRLTDLKRQEVRGGRGRTWRTRTRPCISSRTPTRRPAIAPDPRAGVVVLAARFSIYLSIVKCCDRL